MKPQRKEHAIAQPAFEEYAAGAIIASQYRLLYPLGEGGMGSVWAAYSSTLDINVALKLIRVDVANEEAPQRMVQEARATARLADPGIVRMFDVGCTDRGEPFIAMELLTGATLHTTLEAGSLDAVRAVRLLLPIVRALETAHRAGVVHRDVKPDNILFAVGARGDLQPKLVDFGVAKLLTNHNQLTQVGAVVGSPQYMSPEQARGEAIDHRTDLWSVCVVLHEATLGAPPFTGQNTHALLHAISTQEFSWSPGCGALDPTLAGIIRKGLAKDREARWQHARDLMLALAEWLRQQGVTQDITGVALRGRGLGEKSSLPGPPLAPGSTRRRVLGTAVNVAIVRETPGAAASSNAALLGARAGLLGAWPRLERRVWLRVALVALGLLAGAALSGIWFRSTQEPGAQAPTAPSAPAVLSLPSADMKPADAAELATAAPLTPPDSAQPPRRSPEAPAPRKAAPRAKQAPATQRPRSAAVPFKNPFE
ncbi:MAG: protein kinase [Deltaproteobacteria bacterium]